MRLATLTIMLGISAVCLPTALHAQTDETETQEFIEVPVDDAVAMTEGYETTLTDDDCVVIASGEDGELQSCSGFSGYGILKTVSEERMSVFFGYVGNWYAEGAYESFEAINHIADVVEWRVRDGVPRATIVRWTIDHGKTESGETDPEIVGEVLVVSKVAQPGEGEGCVIGYVDALENENADEIAREVADTMLDAVRCRLDEPEYHGEEGTLTGFRVRTFSP